MTPLNCDKASFLLERRWDKALSPEEERALDSHLTVCETCREEAAAIELADAAFADLPTLEPCRDIAAAVATAIARETGPEPKRWWFWAFSATLAAAVTAIWQFGLTIHVDWKSLPLLSTAYDAAGVFFASVSGWVTPILQIAAHLAPTLGPIVLVLMAIEMVAILTVMTRRSHTAGATRRVRGF